METKIVINWTGVVFGIFSVIITLFGFFFVRLIKKYDDQIRELFERTKDLPALREAIGWLKEEFRNKKK